MRKAPDIIDINKAFGKVMALIVLSSFFFSCEDPITPKLAESQPQVVVDAWLNNLSQPQTIRVTLSQSYFDATAPPAVRNASVYVVDDEGLRYDFPESNPGEYVWTPPSPGETFGQVGREYNLIVDTGSDIFSAQAAMNRVPQVDSVSFRLENNNFLDSLYFAQFFARDMEGLGDTYWIKAFKNGSFLNKPNEINIAFDAGFTAGAVSDGINFIQPIRDGINPFETDDEDNLISPYVPGDSVFVEIHSINIDAFVFLNEVLIQTDRPGGFAELFAVPLSNVPTNLVNIDPNGPEALGFFCVSAVTSGSGWLDPDNLPEDLTP